MMYEHILFFKGNLSKEELGIEIKKYEEYFKRHNIKVKTFENVGLKKLAYEIRNNKEGICLRYEFSCDGKEIFRLEKFTRENDNVIKFITVQNDKVRDTNINNFYEEIERLNESNLFKAIAEEVVFQLNEASKDRKEIELDIEDVKAISELVLDDDYFNESMNNAVKYAIDEKYIKKKNKERIDHMKRECKYEEIIGEAMEHTTNGNYCIDLRNEYGLDEQKIKEFRELLDNDERVNDVEWSKNGTEADVIFYLENCPNATYEEEEDEI